MLEQKPLSIVNPLKSSKGIHLDRLCGCRRADALSVHSTNGLIDFSLHSLQVAQSLCLSKNCRIWWIQELEACVKLNQGFSYLSLGWLIRGGSEVDCSVSSEADEKCSWEALWKNRCISLKMFTQITLLKVVGKCHDLLRLNKDLLRILWLQLINGFHHSLQLHKQMHVVYMHVLFLEAVVFEIPLEVL